MKKLLLILLTIFTLTFSHIVKINAEGKKQEKTPYDLTLDVNYYTNDEVENKKLEYNLNLIKDSLTDYLSKLPSFIIKIDNKTSYTTKSTDKDEVINETYLAKIQYQNLYTKDELSFINLLYKKDNIILTKEKEEKIKDLTHIEQFFTKAKNENEKINIGYISKKSSNEITKNKETEIIEDEKDYELINKLPNVKNLILLENIPFIYKPYKLINKNIYKNSLGYTYRDKDLLFVYDKKLVLKNIYKYNIEIENLTKEQIKEKQPKVISKSQVTILQGKKVNISDKDLEENNYIKKIGKYNNYSHQIDTKLTKVIAAIFLMFMLIALLIGITIVIHYSRKRRKNKNRIIK